MFKWVNVFVIFMCGGKGKFSFGFNLFNVCTLCIRLMAGDIEFLVLHGRKTFLYYIYLFSITRIVWSDCFSDLFFEHSISLYLCSSNLRSAVAAATAFGQDIDFHILSFFFLHMNFNWKPHAEHFRVLFAIKWMLQSQNKPKQRKAKCSQMRFSLFELLMHENWWLKNFSRWDYLSVMNPFQCFQNSHVNSV